ncbi:uncharacterized protein B0H64DRAFT_453130 [Chaetomium fimeti]|uniref:Uncharacterized protein n=1 Tax=Chaetomium fimeti TaxID=1854472 RepID=A0AAE0H5P4_9PEZI|nr:hypothetical protein B0H64DRAFT_453130 [Chaetomium fimeti]
MESETATPPVHTAAMEAKGMLHNATNELLNAVADQLYYGELDTIRREQPLFDPGKFRILKLGLYDRDDTAEQPRDHPGGSNPPTASININMRGGAAPSESPLFTNREGSPARLSPFLIRVLAKAVSIDILDDSDGDEAQAAVIPVPGPLSKMRLDIPGVRQLIGYKRPLEEEFPEELEVAKADFLTTGYGHMDQESMLQGPDWLGYLRNYGTKSVPILFKGFPLVEDVVFVKHPNYWQRLEVHRKLVASGQCYWLAIALLVYGNASFWLRVKAEHLNYAEKVLGNPKHPRHAFYSRENQGFMATKATGPTEKGGTCRSWPGVANLWERLHIPGCWTSEDMCQLTADVYGVFLVLYKFDSSTNPRWKNKVYDMKTYGAYNSRHIFLCYTGENHYQPMVPNEFYASEFRLPRLTLQNTFDEYRLLTRPHRRPRDGPWHHWRGQAQVAPSPLALPGYKPEHLARAVGYDPDANEPLPESQAQPPPQPRTRSPPQLGIESANAERVEAALLTNPELLMSPKVAREVVSLMTAETSGGLPARPPTQADAQAARQAIRLLSQYIDRTSGSHVTQSGRHPLPSSNPSTAPTPRDKGKRPATDPAGPSPSPKRLRTSPGPPAPAPPSSSRFRTPPSPGTRTRSFKPINSRRQPTAAPYAHPKAESSRNTLARSPHTAIQPPNAKAATASTHTQPQPAPKPVSQPVSQPAHQPAPQSQPANNPNDPNDNTPFYRPGTKSLLTKTRIHRLRGWIRTLGLADPHENLIELKKELLVNRLLAAGVEVLMERAVAGGASVIVEEDREGGEGVVRILGGKGEGKVEVGGGEGSGVEGKGDEDGDGVEGEMEWDTESERGLEAEFVPAVKGGPYTGREVKVDGEEVEGTGEEEEGDGDGEEDEDMEEFGEDSAELEGEFYPEVEGKPYTELGMKGDGEEGEVEDIMEG